MNFNARIAALEQLAADRLRVPVAIDINRLTPDERERLEQLESKLIEAGGKIDFTGWSDEDLTEIEQIYARASTGIHGQSPTNPPANPAENGMKL